jgi:hypothetical protein
MSMREEGVASVAALATPSSLIPAESDVYRPEKWKMF